MARIRSVVPVLYLATALPLLVTGCSIKKMAINSVANSLSGGGTGAYLTDNDPVLVGEALPFSLKLMETILLETPEHQGLLLAAGSGFVLYGHAYVLQPARRAEASDLSLSREERARAKRLFLRGRDYVGRNLELRSPGILQALRLDPEGAASTLGRGAIPAMYWYATASGSAVSADKNDMELVADVPVISALLNRALALDESWNQGAIHELLMVLKASGSIGPGGGSEEVEAHFRRAMELNEGSSIGPLVSMAETVCVQGQDRERFETLLEQALDFDVDAHPETRLANLISQEQARWLLSQADLLFVENQAQALEGQGLHGGNLPWTRDYR
jgi:predicted anti-sigma-YlaC factor YlaD